MKGLLNEIRDRLRRRSADVTGPPNSELGHDGDTPDDTDRPAGFFESAWLEALAKIEEERGRELTAEEITQLGSDLPKLLAGPLAESLRDQLIKDSPRMLKEHRQLQSEFESRINKLWGKAFDRLKAVIVAGIEVGEEFNSAERQAAAAENDFVFEAVVRLHARACRIASEVLSLMRAGYAMGAMARVRALQENVVVLMFIRAHGPDIAERYLLHQHATAYGAAVQLNMHADRLGEPKFEADELQGMLRERDELRGRFDLPCYDQDYGWALPVLGQCSSAAHAEAPKTKHRVTFAQIQEKVDMAHYGPLTRLAGRAIHADSRALYWDLGTDFPLDDLTLEGSVDDLLLVGPTNTGFDLPGSVSAYLIGLTALEVVSSREPANPDLVWMAAGVFKLAETVADELAAAERELERQVEKENRRRSSDGRQASRR